MEHEQNNFKTYIETVFLKRLSEVIDKKNNSKVLRMLEGETPIFHSPQVEVLMKWDWNPRKGRYNHYFFSDMEFQNDNPMADYVS